MRNTHVAKLALQDRRHQGLGVIHRGRLGGGRHVGRYDFTWLRDNCSCSGCRHPANGHRLIESWKIPPDITPSALSVDEAGRFCIIFPNSTEAWQNE